MIRYKSVQSYPPGIYTKGWKFHMFRSCTYFGFANRLRSFGDAFDQGFL